MAKYPQVERMTKSVPIHGGLQEDVPEFLQEFGTTAYVENGRFRKKDEIEKTLPEVLVEDQSGFGASPVFLASSSSDDILMGGDNRIVRVLDDGTVEPFSPLRVQPHTLESVFEIGSRQGAMQFTWVKTTTKYVVAYETRSYGVQAEDDWSAGNFQVFVEEYSLEGTFLDRNIIDNAYTPKLVLNEELDEAYLYYVSGTTLYHYHVRTKTVTQVATGVYVMHGPSEAIRATGSAVTYPKLNNDTESLVGGNYNLTRIGFYKQGRVANYQVEYSFNRVWIVYQSDQWELTGLYLDSDGFSQVVSPVVLDNTLAALVTVGVTPLAMSKSGTGTNAKIYVLFIARDSVTDVTRLVMKRYNYTFGTEEAEEILIPSGKHITGGSIVGFSSTVAYVAYTSVDSTETDKAYAISKVTWGSLSGSTFSEWGSRFGYRVTSNPVVYKNGFAFTVEQSVLNEPGYAYNETVHGNFKVPEIPLAQIKSASTVLLYVTSTSFFPISTIDAGSSKQSIASMREQNPHLNKLSYDGISRFEYLNRIQTEVEGIELWMYPNYIDVNKGLYKLDDQNVSWYTGEGSGNFVKIETSPSRLQTTKYGKSVIINSGMPLWYDGGRVSELSVIDAPEIVSVDVETQDAADKGPFAYAVTGPLQDTIDQWVVIQAVFSFVDGNGQVHRSAPSIPMYVWGLTPTTSQRDTLIVRTTAFLSCLPDDKEYNLEVYFAKATDDIPQLVYTGPADRDAQFKFMKTSQEAADPIGAQDRSNPVTNTPFVYTGGTSGQLASDPWLPFTQSVVTSQRLFSIYKGQVYFSKPFQDGLSPEFNGTLVIPFGRNRQMTALGKIDDKVIVFERNAIHAVYGEGPDASGAGQPFVVDPIQTTVGCVDPQSVVEIPDGLLFYSQTDQEFHLLDRNLEVQDIGNAVQDLSKDITVRCSVMFPRENEVRWYVSGGPTEEFGPTPASGRPPRPRYTNVLPQDPVIVLNFEYWKWTVLSNQPAAAAIVHNDEVHRLDDSFSLYRTSETWKNSNFLKYRLPPLRVQNLQSFGKIREISLLGKYLSSWVDTGSGVEAGDIQITARYDYEEQGVSHTYRWRANRDLDPADGDRLQIALKPGRPKCQAIQITVEEVPTQKLDENEPDYTNGRGFVMSGLDVLYWLKRGLGTKSLGTARTK